MSDEVVIRISRLSKTYRIYEQPLDRLKQSLWRGRKQFYREFHALREVSFEVKRGQAVGIIGRNGSGKSTLLQMIAGTLTPTMGEVSVSGRLAALLELGSGFNPEFSGRENVFLNGAILGLDQAEVAARFDSIAAFADIGDFIEQPVKSYSSGMVVRLAFAVASSIEPDILIVDEALSVGDELFQRKCFDRIHQLQKQGTTLLFVSHSAQSVVELCDSAVLLDGGEVLKQGVPKAVVAAYHKMLFAPAHRRQALRQELLDGHAATPETAGVPNLQAIANTRKNSQDAELLPQASYDPNLMSQSVVSYAQCGAAIENVRVETLSGQVVNQLCRGDTYVIAYDVHFTADAYAVRFGTLIKSISGLELGGSRSAVDGEEVEFISSGEVTSVKFSFRCMLVSGTYFFNAGCDALVNSERLFLHRITDAGVFRVLPEADLTVSGLVDFEMSVSLTRVTVNSPDEVA
jgi:lipopolysaccharide transport system ATP-binding protein